MERSDDGDQDTTWVQYAFTLLLEEERTPVLRAKMDAATMTHATVITDNWGKQFNCQFIFGWISDGQVSRRWPSRDTIARGLALQ